MIAVLITIFVAVLIGVSLIGPISSEVQYTTQTSSALANSSSWGNTVLRMVPGFFALMILGVAVAGLYTVFRQAGIV